MAEDAASEEHELGIIECGRDLQCLAAEVACVPQAARYHLQNANLD
jgi:hypothetical protein